MKRIDSLVLGSLLNEYGLAPFLMELGALSKEVSSNLFRRGDEKESNAWRISGVELDRLSINKDVLRCQSRRVQL